DEGAGEGPQPPLRHRQRPGAGRAALFGGRARAGGAARRRVSVAEGRGATPRPRAGGNGGGAGPGGGGGGDGAGAGGGGRGTPRRARGRRSKRKARRRPSWIGPKSNGFGPNGCSTPARSPWRSRPGKTTTGIWPITI